MLVDFVSKAILTLAIGGLIGLEREHAKQIVGVRTFALTALLGFLLSFQQSELFSAVGLAGMFAFSTLFYYFKAKHVPEGWGVTTPLMLPYSFLMGSLIG
ncbi:MAG: MgtC/SapB family protein [Candidatus Micrarchaeota archaeon]